MRVSLSWIRRLLATDDLGLTPQELQARLSTRVAEIEPELERSGPNLDGVVVGKVLTCVQHPNADRLRCTTVDIGGGVVKPIVCGAPNVAAGQTVAVATLGTTLTMPGKDGAPVSVTIKASKLRGEPSEGMICAEDELGLGSSHDGIIVLEDRWAAGTPLARVFPVGDTVFVIENHALTHRPDLWGQLGWAREIAAALGRPTPTTPGTAWESLGEGWSARIADDGCTTYCGAVVEGVHNGESPAWLRACLESCGVRPLGLLVDVTNFVMLELGEPMHAFDRRSLQGSTITVRGAVEGERFTTLDGKELALGQGDLLICDDQRAVALAGIMGGANSLVRADTTQVVLEAAVFRPDRIRRTRMRTGVSTDSATRFEKGQPAENAAAALTRAIALLAEPCPGRRVTHRFSAGRLAGERRTFTFDPAAVTRFTGMVVPEERQRAILSGLGFAIAGSTVTAPWWRAKDVHGPADLVEEVARHHGYEHLTPEVPRLPAAAPEVNLLRQAEYRARDVLSAHGWDEVASYAFTSEAWIQALGTEPAPLIRLAHPLSSEQTVLRPNLVPGLAAAVALNRKHQAAVALFEVGKRYGIGIGHGATPDETVMVAGATAAAGDEAPVYAARDAALALLEGLGHPGTIRVRTDSHPVLADGRALDLLVGGQVVGAAGELRRPLRDLASCPERVGYFCVHLEELMRAAGAARPVTHRMPSRFPAVEREFTWVCPEALTYGELATATRRAAGALGRGVELITVYRGQPYAAGEKAVSLRLTVQADDRTLEEAELNGIMAKVVNQGERLGARLAGRA